MRDELDRRHPERTKLRPTDVAGLQQAFDVVEEMWAPTIERARRLRPPMLRKGERRVLVVETFRLERRNSLLLSLLRCFARNQFGKVGERVVQMLRRKRRESDALSYVVRHC